MMWIHWLWPQLTCIRLQEKKSLFNSACSTFSCFVSELQKKMFNLSQSGPANLPRRKLYLIFSCKKLSLIYRSKKYPINLSRNRTNYTFVWFFFRTRLMFNIKNYMLHNTNELWSLHVRENPINNRSVQGWRLQCVFPVIVGIGG